MSRIGRLPIQVPSGVNITIADGNFVTVKGPKGELKQQLPQVMSLQLDNGVLTVARPDDTKQNKALHGLTRALLQNMVVGVTQGYSIALDMVGVGYRAQKQGNKLVLTVGYSHPVEFEDTADYEFEVPAPTKIVVKGINKQIVGNVAANVRKVREPEPYLGKGIKYENEHIRRKVGKAGK